MSSIFLPGGEQGREEVGTAPPLCVPLLSPAGWERTAPAYTWLLPAPLLRASAASGAPAPRLTGRCRPPPPPRSYSASKSSKMAPAPGSLPPRARAPAPVPRTAAEQCRAAPCRAGLAPHPAGSALPRPLQPRTRRSQ